MTSTFGTAIARAAADDHQARAWMGGAQARERRDELGPSLALPIHAQEQDARSARVARWGRTFGNLRVAAGAHADHAFGGAAVALRQGLGDVPAAREYGRGTGVERALERDPALAAQRAPIEIRIVEVREVGVIRVHEVRKSGKRASNSDWIWKLRSNRPRATNRLASRLMWRNIHVVVKNARHGRIRPRSRSRPNSRST